MPKQSLSAATTGLHQRLSKLRDRQLSIFSTTTLSLILACSLNLFSPVLAVPDSFQAGVGDYNGGHYARALSTFQTFKASYPNNALVHYYIALCQQGLGHIDQAKAEYQWVITSRDPSLAAKAASGFAQLSNVRTTGSGGGSGGMSASRPPTAAAPGGSGSERAPQAKVKKVLDFWATW